MKVIVIRANLKEGVSASQIAINEGGNLPILKNVLLEADGGKIKITATNLELAASFSISGKVIEKGKATVPAAALSAILSNLQSERINLEKKKDGLEIKTDNYSATLEGLPANDFPVIPKIKNTEEFLELESAEIRESLLQVMAAAQFSDFRPELNNILVNFSLDDFKLVSTDSSRLAEKTIRGGQFKSNYQEGFKALIPLKTAEGLLKILTGEGAVKIYRDPSQIFFKTERAELISRLSEGNFPEYDHIIPKNFGAEAVVAKDEIVNAIKLTGVFAGHAGGEVRIVMAEGKKAIEISSAAQALGENNYLLPAKVNGQTKETGFNWRYLIDGLKSIKTEKIFLGINDDNHPTLIKSPSDNSYFYILMPVLRA